MIDVRIARRRTQVRRDRQRRRLRRTMVVVGLLAVVVALLLVERSPLVAITRVEVQGTRLLSRAEVRDAAGVEVGTSLVRVDLGAVRQAVEALPNVRRADVERVEPLVVQIRVTERFPAFLATQGDSQVVLDRTGMVLEKSGPKAGLTPITVRGGPLPGPGHEAVAGSALANVVALSEGLPYALRQRIDTWSARCPDRAVVVLDDGTPVDFGRAQDVDAQARALAVVLEDLDGRRVHRIDVRASSQPVVDLVAPSPGERPARHCGADRTAPAIRRGPPGDLTGGVPLL